ncbi:MAG: YciI family protein [Armatimonadetes bacterium]|nr:YciI family protein [Armatimonadota bacterium]
MYYLLLYDVVDDYVNRRAPYRAEHRNLATAAHQRGELIMGGAFADPMDGAALVFRTDDPLVPRRFAEADPYVQNGLVTDWRVRAWTVVIGG